MFIYIATIGPLTKIGTTRDVRGRMQGLGYKEGERITMVCAHHVGDFAHAIERELGKRFQQHRRHGRNCKRGRDWFNVPAWQMRCELMRLLEQCAWHNI